MKFSKQIKNIRLKHKLTQQQFGLITGLSNSQIEKYENARQEPRLKALRQICRRFPQYALSFVIDDTSVKQNNIPNTGETNASN